MISKLKKIFEASGQKPASIPVGDDTILMNAYSTKLVVPEPKFPHIMNARRNHSDPELKSHLDGLIGFILRSGSGEMTRTRYHLMRHVQRAQQHLSLSVSPQGLDEYYAWAASANAITFTADGSLRDTHGRVLLDASGTHQDSEAEIAYPAEAWKRKEKTDALLSEMGIVVPTHLPPLISEPELQLRSGEEIAQRALALFAVAVRAETLNSNQPMSADEIQARLPHAFGHLTADERSFLSDDSPSPQAIAKFGWRYECVLVLEWALGLTQKLPYPSAICDVPMVAGLMLQNFSSGNFKKVKVRRSAEILDALDLHYRFHWAVREAQVKKVDAPKNLMPGVVSERHYALNWLVRFEDADWDRVDTPT